MDLGRYYNINDAGTEIFRRFDNVFADTVDTNYVDIKSSDQITENSGNKLQLLFNAGEIDVRTYTSGAISQTRQVAFKEETYTRTQVRDLMQQVIDELEASSPYINNITNPF